MKYMSKIKIFVSHRIDLSAQTIDNPLFVNIRCGAVFDKRTNIDMQGDHTGNNISCKRQSFNELTVHYWAWKNVDADYYGLCHYRRFFSFSKSRLPGTDTWGQVHCARFTGKSLKKYGITTDSMENEILNCDVIVPEKVELKNIGYRSNMDALKNLKNAYNMQDVNILWEVIQEKYPEYYADAMEYMHQSESWLYNCFIMKKAVFLDYSKWLFDILFEFEKRINMQAYSMHMLREPAHLAERLLGIYVYHLKKHTNCVIHEKQLVKIDNTDLTIKSGHSRANVKQLLLSMLKAFFPYGSRPYRIIKGAYFKRRGWTYNPQNDMPRTREDSVFEKILKNIFPPSAQKFQRQLEDVTRTIRRYGDKSILYACLANEIRDTNKETFRPYRGMHVGERVVIIGTGPTLNYFQPIKGSINIGLNGAYHYSRANLDYYFVQDYQGDGTTFSMDEIAELDCVKFFGKYLERKGADKQGIPDSVAVRCGAKQYFVLTAKSEIPINIEYFPVMDHDSIAFAAVHFALYTYPKQIFLVGIDAKNDGHFDGSMGADVVYGNEIRKGMAKVRDFAQKHFPDTQFVVVNPVGLKGVFSREVYTQPFLNVHPEVREQLGEYCTLLSDIVEIEEDEHKEGEGK